MGLFNIFKKKKTKQQEQEELQKNQPVENKETVSEQEEVEAKLEQERLEKEAQAALKKAEEEREKAIKEAEEEKDRKLAEAEELKNRKIAEAEQEILEEKEKLAKLEAEKKQEEQKLEAEQKEEPKEEKKKGFLGLFSKKKKEKLNKGLEKTKESVFKKLTRAVVGKSKVDDEVLDNLEEVLITSDVGVNTTLKIIQRIEEKVSKDKYFGTEELNKILKAEIANLLEENNVEASTDYMTKDGNPYVILVVGVNGVGKTTTIGKLAYMFKNEGKKVYIGAADTFRAAAVDQLTIWAEERVGVPIVKQKMGSDPASVAFDAVTSAKMNNADVVIIDTAGRLHNKVNLMNELTKIKRVMQKVIPDAPHEILLILDGSTGQNAFEQAKQFTKATEVSALALTKLDGTAKGGVVIGISDQFKIPVKYIGIGEGMEDLQIFNKKEFVKSLFGEEE